jgi:hypothetical protein
MHLRQGQAHAWHVWRGSMPRLRVPWSARPARWDFTPRSPELPSPLCASPVQAASTQLRVQLPALDAAQDAFSLVPPENPAFPAHVILLNCEHCVTVLFHCKQVSDDRLSCARFIVNICK